jgi:hypothetical protein
VPAIKHDLGKVFIKNLGYMPDYMLIDTVVFSKQNNPVAIIMQRSQRMDQANFTTPDLFTTVMKNQNRSHIPSRRPANTGANSTLHSSSHV